MGGALKFQIYRDTLKRLRDRGDMYRLMLEHALSHAGSKCGKSMKSPDSRPRNCANV